MLRASFGDLRPQPREIGFAVRRPRRRRSQIRLAVTRPGNCPQSTARAIGPRAHRSRRRRVRRRNLLSWPRPFASGLCHEAPAATTAPSASFTSQSVSRRTSAPVPVVYSNASKGSRGTMRGHRGEDHQAAADRNPPHSARDLYGLAQVRQGLQVWGPEQLVARRRDRRQSTSPSNAVT